MGREDIFLPALLPRKNATVPTVKVNNTAYNGRIPQIPLLRPVAAESRELAAASAAASRTDSDFEQSQSAAVSSRYSLIIRPAADSLSSRPAKRLTALRVRLFNTFAVPMEVSTANPAIRHISGEIKPHSRSDSSRESPSTAAPAALMTAADLMGIRIPLPEYAAAASMVSTLTVTASSNSHSITSPHDMIFRRVKNC